MNGPTLDQIIGRVRAELSEEDAEFFTDAAVIKIINAGQDAISMDCPWTAVAAYTISTVAGSPSYLLPDEATHPTAVFYTPSSGRRNRLDYIEPDVMDSWTNRTTRAIGTPSDVTYRKTEGGMEIEVWRAPSVTGATLTVYTMIRPTELVETTDRTDIHPSAIPILVDYVLARLKGKDEELPQANAYIGSYENGLKDLKARHMIEQADQFNRTRAYRGMSRRHRGGYGR